MARSSPLDYYNEEVAKLASFSDVRYFRIPWSAMPRQVAVGANAAVVSGNHPLMESVSTGTTVYFNSERGLSVEPGSTQYDCVAIVPAVQTLAAGTILAAGIGTGSTARTSGALAATLKTGAATDLDSGHSIGFLQQVIFPSKLPSNEGTSITYASDLVTYFGLYGGTIANMIAAATTDNMYVQPADGFGFYGVVNGTTPVTWKFYTHSGSDVDTALDTGVPIVPDVRYTLAAILDTNRYAHCYINGKYIGMNSVAVDATTALGPYIAAKGTAASSATRPLILSSDLVLTAGNVDYM